MDSLPRSWIYICLLITALFFSGAAFTPQRTTAAPQHTEAVVNTNSTQASPRYSEQNQSQVRKSNAGLQVSENGLLPFKASWNRYLEMVLSITVGLMIFFGLFYLIGRRNSKVRNLTRSYSPFTMFRSQR